MNASHFKVEQLRAKNLIKSVESLVVLVLALFVSALLPSLLIRYVYANQQLFEQPKLLEYIPVAAFVVGVGYFLFAMVGNLMREMNARKLEAEIELMGDDCGCGCGCGSHHDDEWLKELDEPTMSSATKKVSKARKIAKK